MAKQWIPISEAAQALRLSYNAAARLMFVGTLIGRREGRAWLVDGASVERYAKECGRPEISASGQR